MTRADVVRAMEIMVSTINDETIIDSWLMVGVADGDITAETTNEEIEPCPFVSVGQPEAFRVSLEVLQHGPCWSLRAG